MKLIKQSFEIVNQTSFDIQGIYKHIELCTRVSYKSEDKITEDSANKFVSMLLNMKHLAPLEFGTIHIKIPSTMFTTICMDLMENDLYNNMWFKYYKINDYYYVSLNYRYYLDIQSKLPYISNLVDYSLVDIDKYPKRYTCKIITSRAIAQEITRHRTFSFCMESQRFCAYNKGKFGNQITYILPPWFTNIKVGKYDMDYDIDKPYVYTCNDIPVEENNITEQCFLDSCWYDEQNYFALLQEQKPQQARIVLNNNVKTELYMCGDIDAWKHFFKLRDNEKVDPQMYDLAKPLHEEFIEKKLL